MPQIEQVRALLQTTVPRLDWDDPRPLMDAGLLDSLDVLMIVSALNEAFGVELPSTELTAANFNSVKAIWRLCQTYAVSKR